MPDAGVFAVIIVVVVLFVLALVIAGSRHP